MNDRENIPSAYTSIYWLIQDKKIIAKDLFIFKELYWPSFIEKDGYVFLKEEFSEERLSNLIIENHNPEYWINLLTVDDFFSELPDSDEKSIEFARTLVGIWTVKLKCNFPSKKFKVDCLYDEEYGDCGLTFYQSDKG